MSEAFKESYLIPSPSKISELREIIRSHSPPSATLLSRSENVVDNGSLELARYTTEIQTLEETLAKLKSERALLESYAHECRSIFSPARRLPTELLVEIFDLCSPDFNSVNTVEQEENRLAKTYLFHISRVCYRWHDIIMNSPKLWSTITVDTGLWHESAISSATLLASSLKRGADFPLTLKAGINPRHLSHQSVLELLAQHSRRWKTVCLWLYPSHLTFLAHARGNIPVLETLILHSTHPDNVEPTAEVFTAAPRLKMAKIFGFGPSFPSLPWGQLLQLTIGNGQCHTLSLKMLPLLSTEARCTLALFPAKLKLPLNLPFVTSGIASLDIGFNGERNKTDDLRAGEALGEIFHTLSLPSLRHLSIFGAHGGPPPVWNVLRFLDFASRSMLCNTLRSFKVHSIITDVEILDSFRVLPLLEELQIADADKEHTVITDRLLQQLTWQVGPGEPHSTSPGSRLAHTGDFSEESFLEFASSRIVAGRSGCWAI
ncbi:hypothetical protein B0H16DRAFT_1857427 [Mycena metata]|uniref:F-box domain-containing protein n=1 Tax=Mycena metata TaxID=1033252 RepID=A0AAD7IL35_9AGAR|nr:hypothetical protein B0H16DRAFT_1857427 [Mycena metata]